MLPFFVRSRRKKAGSCSRRAVALQRIRWSYGWQKSGRRVEPAGGVAERTLRARSGRRKVREWA